MIPLGIIAAATPRASSGSIYLDSLDQVPRVVLSLRKLISTATKSIRVRRSSDNTEQDIGFSGDGLDTPMLLAFAGGSSVYVTTFYDQTGNTEDALQLTVGKQPRIVNAGVADNELVFNGVNGFMKIATLAQDAAQVGIYAKFRQVNSTTYKILFEVGVDGYANPGAWSWYAQNDNNSQVLAIGQTGGGRSTVFPLTSFTSLTQATALLDRSLTGTAETKLWVESTPMIGTIGGNNNTTGNFSANDLFIGARAGTSLFANMGLDTLVIYNSNTAGIRNSIEAIVQ